MDGTYNSQEGNEKYIHFSKKDMTWKKNTCEIKM